MSTLRDAPSIEPLDGFALFEGFCAAAGIGPGAERIAVFLDLPEPLQVRVLGELALRMAEEASS